MRCRVKAILETTFDQGVLAVYRKEAIACSDADIGLFKGLGEVLCGLYYRQEDLAQLRRAQTLPGTGLAGKTNQHLAAIIGATNRLRPPAAGTGVQACSIAHVRPQKTRKEQVNFTRLVQETVGRMRRALLQDQIEIVAALAPDLPYVKAHAGQLQQVLLNLIQNSHDAIKQVRGTGRIELRLSTRQGCIVLEVEDNGPGIAKEIRADIFAPFFTTKASSQHSGLGLSICTGIACDHHGRLFVEDCAQGACVVLELPINPPAALALLRYVQARRA